jgi:hypothetical protein
MNYLEEIKKIKLSVISFSRLIFMHIISLNVDNPSCQCGYKSQSTKHLFFQCPLFNDLRQKFFLDLGLLPSFNSVYSRINCMDDRLQLLLNGHSSLSYETNFIVVL